MDSVYSWQAFPGFSLTPPLCAWPCLLCGSESVAVPHPGTPVCLSLLAPFAGPAGAVPQLIPSWAWRGGSALPALLQHSDKPPAQGTAGAVTPTQRALPLTAASSALLCMIWIMLSPPTPEGFVFAKGRCSQCFCSSSSLN